MLVALKWRSGRLAMYMEYADCGTRGYPKNIWYSGPVGIDGITKRDLKQERGQHCAIQFVVAQSVTLRLGKQTPDFWFPKLGKDFGHPKNWSPINISLMISRIFSSLLDHRLRNIIEQSERQKGFTNENGCYNNIQLINKTMVAAKTSSGIVVVLDISKAFDSVSHEAIQVSVQRDYWSKCWSCATAKESTTPRGLGVGLVSYHSDPKSQKRGFFVKDRLKTFELLNKTHSIVAEAMNGRRERRKEGEGPT